MTVDDSLGPQCRQIRQTLMAEIERGAYRTNQPCITEWEICECSGVSRATAICMLSDMVHNGVLTRRRGVGTFVAAPARAGSPVAASRTRETDGPRLIGYIDCR
jgi:GntR family transcriptional regulator of arabinose operon